MSPTIILSMNLSLISTPTLILTRLPQVQVVRSIVAVMEYAASRDFQFAPPDVPLQQLTQEEHQGAGSNGGSGAVGGGGIEDLLSPAFADTVTVTVRLPVRRLPSSWLLPVCCLAPLWCDGWPDCLERSQYSPWTSAVTSAVSRSDWYNHACKCRYHATVACTCAHLNDLPGQDSNRCRLSKVMSSCSVNPRPLLN